MLVHPECGCAGQLIYGIGSGDLDPRGIHIASTEGMINLVRDGAASEYIIATETGIMHRMAKEAPSKHFLAADPEAVCAYMKAITLENTRDALVHDRYLVTVPPDIAARAKASVDRMIALGPQASQKPGD